ncbi:MAG: glycosyltransferase family 2 protein, partial [Candidatus Roizmanbacteria bacterium]|nr:glycosyltransferase family 2 protein [Candidatus Roizmanbacteria bacterium]
MDKKILILLPIWGRKKITQICLENLLELQKDFKIDVLCIVSESWSKVMAFEYGFRFVTAPNDCLGTKMNIGVEAALKLNFDYLMNLGSDDIITKELLDIYTPYFEKNLEMFGSKRLTFIDSKEKKAKTF